MPQIAVKNLADPQADILGALLKVNEEIFVSTQGSVGLKEIAVTSHQLYLLANKQELRLMASLPSMKELPTSKERALTVVFRALPWIKFLVIDPPATVPEGVYTLCDESNN